MAGIEMVVMVIVAVSVQLRFVGQNLCEVAVGQNLYEAAVEENDHPAMCSKFEDEVDRCDWKADSHPTWRERQLFRRC